MVPRHLREQWSGNGARLARLGENYGVSAREKQAGDFVHGFIAHGAVHQENAAARVILVPEFQQFARAGGIVRAIEVDVRMGSQALEAARPLRRCDAALDGFVIDGKVCARRAGGRRWRR